MIPHLKCRLHHDARGGCTGFGAIAAPRIFLIGVTVIGVAHLTAPHAAAQSGLVAAYSFDEGSGTSVKDSSSNSNNGSITNAAWTASGRYGAALAFNGANALVSVPSSSSLRLTGAMTLEAWIRPTTVSAQWRDVIYKGNDNYFLEGTSNRSGRPAAGGSVWSGNLYGTSALAVNTWTHLATTYDGSTMKLYVNGTLVASGARSGALETSGNPLQIGGDSIFGQYFAGSIDDVRVYNIALTDTQIRTDMNTPVGSASPAPAPLPPADLTLTKSHAGSFSQGQNGAAYTLTVKNSGSSATSGTVSVRDILPSGLTAAAISGSGWSCTLSNLTCTRSDALAAGGSYPSVTVTVNVSTSAPASVTNTGTVSGGGQTNTGNDSASDVTAIASVVSPLPPAPNPGGGLVAAFSFDDGTGSTAQDATSYNNDGTISNATWTSGRFGGALSFNGTSALVTVPGSTSLRLSTAMTLEAWVKPTTVSAQWRDVIYKGNDNYFLEGTSDSSGRPSAGASVWSSNLYGTSALVVNAWTHLAATYDGAAMKLYVNGTVVSSGARGGALEASGNPLEIGGDSLFGQYFAGVIDEVRIYNVALTAAQIQSDMTTPIGAPVAAAPPVSNADTVAPTVALSSPAAGALVGGTVTMTASASDNVGVTSVTFLVDGTAIGSDTAPPYSISWNTAAFAAGSHTLQAQARDAAGNIGSSASVTVTIQSAASGTAMFTASSDDASVNRYVLEIFTNGADVNTAPPAASQDLGKPPVVNGEYAADVSATLGLLPTGTYIATVTAEGSGGKARSAPSPSFSVTNTTMTTLRRPDMVTTSGMTATLQSAPASASTTPLHAAAVPTLWVTSSSAHIVAAFDAMTGGVLAMIPVGTRPVAVAAPIGSGRVYVAEEESDTVSVIDTASMTRLAVIALPAPFGRKPHRLAGSADGARLFVSEGGSNVVDVIDTAADQLVARFAAGQPGTTIVAAMPDATGQILYALSRGGDASQNALAAIEAATGRWLWVMPIAEDVGDLTLEPDGRTALVSVPAKNAILFIDLERRVSMGAADLGTGNAPAALRSSSVGHVIVTLESARERVGIVDPASNVRIVPLADVSAAQALRPDARDLSYITMADESGVVGIDPASGGVVRRFALPAGSTAGDVTFDPR